MQKRFIWLGLVLLLGLSARGFAQNFLVEDIRIEGLQRISAGTVFAAIPISVGDEITRDDISKLIAVLFRTGNFENIQIGRDDNVLVVIVQERPSISEIVIEGNKAIETDALLKGLKSSGLAEGQVFKRSTLEGIRLELQRQYVAQGRYDAEIQAEVVEQPRNRVSVNINIDEGTVARIKHINIVGSSAYERDLLLDEFELNSTGFWSFISGDDKYSKEKLQGDLETLESYYMDRGYVKFNIDSTQVSISPTRDAVYITINITEGDVYEINAVDLSGDIKVDEADMRKLLLVRKGQKYSQQLVTTTEELLTKRLGNEGYTFAKVTGVPDIDEENKTVDMKFYVDPGKRTYVRHINFRGNTKTVDEVLRREMRQMESTPAASHLIEHSRVRLNRLGFFKDVKVETPEVPGFDDMIDVDFTVEEQYSGSIGASIGYADGSGLIIGANLQQSNFLGTGRQIGVGVNTSKYQTNYRFSYLNPYYTEDGVSRGFSVYYRKTNLDEVGVARYNTDTLGANMNFGYPLSEIERLGFSLGYSHTEITTGIYAVQEITTSPVYNQDILYGVDPTIYTSNITPTLEDINNVLVNYGGAGIDADDVILNELDSPDLTAITDASLRKNPDGFLDIYGDKFDNYSFSISYRRSTLNRGRLATRGTDQSIGLEITVPGSDLEYFKLTYSGQIFFPLSRSFTLRLRTELGYGEGYGDTDTLPFYENFFAGGFRSVRGYERNSLGPRSTNPELYYGRDSYRVREDVNGNPLAYQDYYKRDPNDCSILTDADGNPEINRDIDGNLVYDDARMEGTCNLVYDYRRDPENLGDPIYYIGPDGKLLYYDIGGEPDPFGGNVSIEYGLDLIFRLPFVKDHASVQTSFFIDGGNVFDTDCGERQLACSNVDFGEIRYSAGFGLTWITAMGPLTFSIAKPFHYGDLDQRKGFDFSLGTLF